MTGPAMSRTEEIVLEQASAWLARLKGGDATDADRAAHAAWLAADPSHRAVWDEIAVTYALPLQAGEADRARLRALAHGWTATAHAPRRSRARGFAMAASFAAILLCGAVLLLPLLTGTRYATAIGELRTVRLEDGSVVHLNAATRLTVRMEREVRLIELTQGQALFQVAKDAARPFRVVAADRTVQAVGTEFDVDRHGAQIDVAVREGTVQVSAAAPVLLSEGQGLTYDQQQVGPVRAVAIAQIGSWQKGLLYYERTPFARIVEDLNRQFDGKFSVEDPTLAQMPVNIAFPLRDRETSLRQLEKMLGVQAIGKENGRTVFVRAPPAKKS
jgi:transmembrane sensor